MISSHLKSCAAAPWVFVRNFSSFPPSLWYEVLEDQRLSAAMDLELDQWNFPTDIGMHAVMEKIQFDRSLSNGFETIESSFDQFHSDPMERVGDLANYCKYLRVIESVDKGWQAMRGNERLKQFAHRKVLISGAKISFMSGVLGFRVNLIDRLYTNERWNFNYPEGFVQAGANAQMTRGVLELMNGETEVACKHFQSAAARCQSLVPEMMSNLAIANKVHALYCRYPKLRDFYPSVEIDSFGIPKIQLGRTILALTREVRKTGANSKPYIELLQIVHDFKQSCKRAIPS